MKRDYDIFISYRRIDVCVEAEHLKDLLEPFYKKRISFDRENLSGLFNAQLIQRIDNVKDFIVVLGKNSFCYSDNDFSEEQVKLYKDLTALSEEEFAERIVEVEKQTPIDYVRIEIGRALRRKDLHIVPVVPERTADYSFATLNLPDDIAQLKNYEAAFYSDSPDALFKDVLPKVRKHLQSKPDLIVNKKLLALLFSVLIIAVSVCGYVYYKNYLAEKREAQRQSMMTKLQNDYQSFGLNFMNNDTLSIVEMAAIAEILDKMQDVIPDSLKMGMYEVTVGQWARIMKQPYAIEDSLMPKTNVSYGDCMAFADKLYALTDIPFEIPTEEDWIYAARGGVDVAHTVYSGSNEIDSVAWYRGNSGGKKHKCDGSKYSNQFGLFDMSGNVSEICNSLYYKDITDDSQQTFKVLRGGNYSSPAPDVTIEARVPFDESSKGNEKIGFRLVIRQESF